MQTRVFPFQNRSGQHLQEGPTRWAADTLARSWVSEVEWLEEQPPGEGSLGITVFVGQGGQPTAGVEPERTEVGEQRNGLV